MLVLGCRNRLGVLERRKEERKRESQFTLVAIVSRRKCESKSLLFLVGIAYFLVAGLTKGKRPFIPILSFKRS